MFYLLVWSQYLFEQSLFVPNPNMEHLKKNKNNLSITEAQILHVM